ncbi:MAG: hypothetical protein E6G10_25505 [Actinobacteria bacterium]|nr:MAG: hypothetical protein E6G10_25505 [Actinomycetota bacterium]
MNALGALVVTFTLAVNLARERPLGSVLAAPALHRLWAPPDDHAASPASSHKPKPDAICRAAAHAILRFVLGEAL